MNPITQIVVTLVPGIILSILTAIITVRLSLGQFREEHHWKKKYVAYYNLIDTLSRAFDYENQYLRKLEKKPTVTYHNLKNLNHLSTSAWDDLRRAEAVGGLIMSSEATNLLNSMEQELLSLNPKDPTRDYLIEKVSILQKYISRLQECAKKDLKVDENQANWFRELFKDL